MCDGYGRLEAEWASDPYREWQESMDYELNAAFDRCDGWDNPDPCDYCPVCGDRGDCSECLENAARYVESVRRNREILSRPVDFDDIPF